MIPALILRYTYFIHPVEHDSYWTYIYHNKLLLIYSTRSVNITTICENLDYFYRKRSPCDQTHTHGKMHIYYNSFLQSSISTSDVIQSSNIIKAFFKKTRLAQIRSNLQIWHVSNKVSQWWYIHSLSHSGLANFLYLFSQILKHCVGNQDIFFI